jgi:adhesin/invasin
MIALHPPRRLPSRRVVALAALLASAIALAACTPDSATDPTIPRALALVSGDSQTVTVGAVTAPLVVRVTGSGDAPLAGVPVAWVITTGGGSLSAAVDTTDADGRSEVRYTAGPTAGSASITAGVSFLATTFNLTLEAGPASRLSKFGADNPAALAGTALQLSAKVSDDFGNGIPGVAVTWAASNGATLSTTTGTSDAGGIVTTTITLGQATGTYTLTATAAGFAPVTYTITAI